MKLLLISNIERYCISISIYCRCIFKIAKVLVRDIKKFVSPLFEVNDDYTPLVDQASTTVGLVQPANTPLVNRASTPIGLAQLANAPLICVHSNPYRLGYSILQYDGCQWGPLSVPSPTLRSNGAGSI